MHMKKQLIVTVSLIALGLPSMASAKQGPPPNPVVTTIATFAAPGCAGGCGSGSTVGPDHALYVTDGKTGRVLRIDPDTGATSTFASGLPTSPAPIGGAMDVTFIGQTAYVLVTLVGPFFGQPTIVDGIYRIEKDGTGTPIADIGAWSIAHPPANTIYFITSGVQYAIDTFRGGFLVTDGHHNRVLAISRKGEITELKTFGDIVPTGLAVHGNTIYMGEAGPVPHLPSTGKVVAIRANSGEVTDVASGASLIVDVELGRGNQLYALSQGPWNWPNDPGNAGLPASPNGGALLRVNDGSFTAVVAGLNQPTSLEFIGDTAYAVTLTGTVVKIDNV